MLGVVGYSWKRDVVRSTWLTLMLVLQARFQEYLTLSDTFLAASIEQGSTDKLPVVRMAYARGIFGLGKTSCGAAWAEHIDA